VLHHVQWHASWKVENPAAENRKICHRMTASAVIGPYSEGVYLNFAMYFSRDPFLYYPLLYCCQSLLNDLFPRGFLTDLMYVFSVSAMRTTPSTHKLLSVKLPKQFCVNNRLPVINAASCNFLHYDGSSAVGQNISATLWSQAVAYVI
jgi:hypothetical protein